MGGCGWEHGRVGGGSMGGWGVGAWEGGAGGGSMGGWGVGLGWERGAGAGVGVWGWGECQLDTLQFLFIVWKLVLLL